MSWRDNPDFTSLIGAVIISTISGIIAIARRLANGQAFSFLWITSEFLSALLCGYLMYDVYPFIADTIPVWLTEPLLIAFAAHLGARVFKAMEDFFYKKYGVNLKE